VLLIAAANRFLAGGEVGDFWPNSEVFLFTRAVIFEDGVTAARDPNRWFAALKASGMRGVLLGRRRSKGQLPAEMPIHHALDTGAPVIEIGDAAQAGCRVPIDRFHDDGGGKSWSTFYVTAAAEGEAPAPPDLEAVTAVFAEILDELAHFAHAHGMDQFVPSFGAALGALRGAPLERNSYLAGYEELLPDMRARSLFVAAAHAHVFGGMGSWDDHEVPQAAEQFLSLTLRLIAADSDASQAVANTTFAWR